jgi:hypothetical protein
MNASIIRVWNCSTNPDQKLHHGAASQNWSSWSTSLGVLTTLPFFSRTECVELKPFG